MSYYTRTEADWDHARDLRKHEPRPGDRTPPSGRVQVLFERDPACPGEIGYMITGPSYRDVQDEITRLMSSVEDGSGQAHFRGPFHVGPRYVAAGKIIMADA